MNTKHAFLVPLVASLAACGGGGETPSNSGKIATQVTSGPETTAVNLPIANLATTVVAPAYDTGSEELAAYTLLNAERSRCGFGKLAQNTALDAAAKGHADWSLINGYGGHYQVANTPGFTGIAPENRIAAAGYAGLGRFQSQDENVTIQNMSSKVGFGERSIRHLLNAPYHAVSLLEGWRDVGISIRNDIDAASTSSHGARAIAQVNTAYKSSEGPQLQAADEVLTYPCAGSTDIPSALTHESPSPVPGRDLSKNPLGSSIQVMLRAGQSLVITSAQITNVASGAAVPVRTPVTSANDPNPGYLRSHQGFVSADVRMTPHTTYDVTVRGTNNGTPFVKSFAFSTGS